MEVMLHALTVECAWCGQVSEALQNTHKAILMLEAQVARREAELESCNHQYIVDVKPIPPKHTIIEALYHSPSEIPILEVVQSLSAAEEHNHLLKLEINELSNHVSCLPPPNYSPNAIVHVTETEGHPEPMFYLSCSPDSTSGIQSATFSISPSADNTYMCHAFSEVINSVGDLKIDIKLLASTINHFEQEAQTLWGTLKLRDSPEARSNLHPAISSALSDSGVSLIPNFQYILGVERECHR